MGRPCADLPITIRVATANAAHARQQSTAADIADSSRHFSAAVVRTAIDANVRPSGATRRSRSRRTSDEDQPGIGRRAGSGGGPARSGDLSGYLEQPRQRIVTTGPAQATVTRPPQRSHVLAALCS